MRDDWAATRRRRWSASRIAAALALHALVLMALKLAIDRVEMPRRAADRATLLVDVALHPAPPPPAPRALPLPKAARLQPRVPAQRSLASRAPAPPAPPARARETEPEAITLPPAGAIAAATPPASAAQPDLSFLDNASTREAIRAAGHGETLASRANALTHEEPGSELLTADGSHAKRNLPPPSPALALAQGMAAAHKADCMKDGAGLGLLAAPVLLVAEAMGKCAR